MKKHNIIFPALFLTLTTMPCLALSQSDCKYIIRNCLAIKILSPNNHCDETEKFLNGIDSDPWHEKYKQERKKIASNDSQRKSKLDSLQEKYEDLFNDKYCKKIVSSTNASKSELKNVTVSGTVIDETGEPVMGATVQNPKTKQGVVTNIDGKFTVTSTDMSELKISYIGYKTQTVKNLNEKNLIVKLEEDASQLQEVFVTNCKKEDKQKINAKEASNRSIKIGDSGKATSVCLADVCIGEPGEYEKQETYLDDDDNCTSKEKLDGNKNKRELCQSVCVKVKCTESEKKALNATEGKIENGKCVPNGCIKDYELKGNVCAPRTECSKSEIDNLKKQDKNIDTVELDASGRCVPKTCKSKYHPVNGKCVENKCPTDEEDWNGKECVKVRCKPDELTALNAKDGKWENNQCIPTKCDEKVYTLKDDICDLIDKRSDEEKRKALEEKQKAYDDAKATEQSLANRTLTAATTAATGIGGMELLQGMAEQSADKDAMADMAAYIETMRCTYGDGKQVKAGPEEIELPGANDAELMKLRNEYLALAADLKERKEALGMKPGIESEVIMDRAQTGLYDDENVGITGGNYASIYRAMMLNSETDQAKIDDAAAASKRRVTGGAIAAGAGVVGGIVGNQLINGKSNKEKDEAKALDKEKKVQETPQKQAEKQTEKEANNKEKTQTQENDSLLTIEALNQFGLGASGKCSQHYFDSDLPLEDGKCGGFLTEKGSWWTSFPYGIVYGESKCGSSKDYTIPCSCRITKITNSTEEISQKTQWEYVFGMNGKDHCNDSCAIACAYGVASSKNLREKLYNKKILEFFQTK